MIKIFYESLLNFVRNNKIIFKLTSELVDIYSSLASLIENTLLRKNSSDYNFNKSGLLKLRTKTDLKKELDFIRDHFKNKPLEKKLNDKQIKHFLEKLFSTEFRKEITYLTGFEYSIDYFRIIINRRTNINKRIAHFDKSFSKNMLKIFIPINTINESGPLKVLNKKDSKLIKNGAFSSDFKKTSLLGDGEYIYAVLPNQCLHEETIPDKNFSSINIMLQLNPSTRWCYRKNLGNLQVQSEPKFQSFTFLFAKKFFFRKSILNI